MAKNSLTIPSLALKIATEADAYKFLEELRWDGEPDGCLHCGEVGATYLIRPQNGVSRKTRTGNMSERRVWKCRACKGQFSVLTGTIFHGTKIPVRTWLFVIVDMCSAKNGMSAREVERKYGVTPKTAWHMLHRIREAMTLEPLAGLMRGTIQADETWIGGNPKNRHRKDPREQGRGKWGSDKMPVLSLVDTATGEVRSRVVPDVTGATLLPVMRGQVDMAVTTLHTDASKSYTGTIARQAKAHAYVTHERDEYVRDGVSTNMAEGYFSQLKRSIDGTHHHVSREHLQRYLNEFDFRYSTCEMDDHERVRTLIERVPGRRLSYRPLTRSQAPQRTAPKPQQRRRDAGLTLDEAMERAHRQAAEGRGDV
ncbi:IS1595 family transposase [Phycicoccus sonneratiae]|uniref:IS1595 family transposase n=1 Tax=Phycicoccus sonneratiae TaxID=2807628 RepID=A0ABS2CRA4_9MICO|nr:IS1595 family transposase [Phycicoccus sonneraticus]MBM6401666.1 IS1595 family transposase [Phycicoccus sonneraticus]